MSGRRPDDADLELVERTGAHAPADEGGAFDTRGEVVIDGAPDDLEDASAILDPIELALLHDPGELPAEAPNDRTVAHDPELFAAVPDPEDLPEPQAMLVDPAHVALSQAPTGFLPARKIVLPPPDARPPPPVAADPDPVFEVGDLTGLEELPDVDDIPDPEDHPRPVPRPVEPAPRPQQAAARAPASPRKKRKKAPAAEPVRRRHRPIPVPEPRPAPAAEPPSIIVKRAAAPNDDPIGTNVLTSVFEPQPEVRAQLPRARLVARGGEHEGKAWYLNRNRTTIGRGTDNDIVLLDIAVSRHHLRIDRHGDGFRLLDLQSGNGTYINGRRVLDAELYDGDAVEVGNTVLGFSTVGKPRLRPAGLREAVTDPSIAAPRSPAPPRRFPLLWIALSALTAFVTVVVTMMIIKSLRDPPAAAAADPAEAAAWVARADDAIAKRSWESARADLEVARSLAPDAPAVTERLALVEREAGHAATLAAARAMVDRGEPPAAVDAQVATIAADSVYAADARALRDAARAAAVDRLVEQAEAARARGHLAAARRLAEQVLTDDAGHAGARRVLAAIDAAERGEDDAGAPPAEVERPTRDPEPAPRTVDADELARRDLAEGTRQYRRERIDAAAQAFERAAKRGAAKGLTRQAADRARWVREFARAWRDGKAAAEARRVVEAIRRLEEARGLDRKLGGHHAGAIQKALVEPWYLDAARAFYEKRYPDAARRTQQVLSADPGHSLAAKLRQRIERQADELYAEARRLRSSDPTRARRLLGDVVKMAGKGSSLARDAEALARDL